MVPSQLQTFFDRIAGWEALNHPHVLRVFGVSDHDADPPFIISQHFPNGNAGDYLMKNSSADRAKIVSTIYAHFFDIHNSAYLQQMFECALGMQFLHGVSSLDLIK